MNINDLTFRDKMFNEIDDQEFIKLIQQSSANALAMVAGLTLAQADFEARLYLEFRKDLAKKIIDSLAK
jgi:hypothetical protein